MPYTLAHAAAVVPVGGRLRGWLPLSALVCGSVAPDLPYFVIRHGVGGFAHTPRGLVTVALPLGLLLLLLFHLLLRRPAVALFPPAHRPALRAVSLHPWGWGHVLRAVPAVFVGALSHVAWDTLTHDELATGPLRFLRQPLLHAVAPDLSIARFLQYATSALGLVLLAFWYLEWQATTQTAGVDDPARPAALTEARRRAILQATSALSVGGAFPYLLVGRTLFTKLELLLIGGTSVAFVSLCGVCAWLVLKTGRRGPL